MALVQSLHSLPLEEVAPDSAMVKNLSRSSILTQRRRVKVQAQTGPTYGSALGNAANNAPGGAGGRQIQFVIADSQGLIDPSSINILYNVQVSGTGTTCMDDGHPFTRMQLALNGQMLEDCAQSAKATNAEVKLATDQGWYSNEGSFCGFGLLNNQLTTGPSPTTATLASAGQAANQQYGGAWGDVIANAVAAEARQQVAGGTFPWNPTGGQTVSVPLGLISGFGRMNQYVPLSVFGELSLTLFTGSRGEVCFQQGGTDVDFFLTSVALTYDVVIPHPSYNDLLMNMANNPNEQGINLPMESLIMASSGTIGSSATLTTSSVIVSRATQNLLRAFAIFQPTAMLTSPNYPIQSCFSHVGAASYQMRVGSSYYPSIPSQGDADMFTCSMMAYGSAARNSCSSVINRNNWGTYTLDGTGLLGTGEPVLTGTAPGNLTATTGNHLSFSDSFIPAMGFRVVTGRAEKLDVDGISLSGASGSQLVFDLTAAPNAGGGTITPTIGLVALRFISAQAGSVRVIGA
jgi:hypothetical protein